MRTSAEEMHHGKLNPQPQGGSEIRLFIDLDRCSTHQCPECTLQCSYYQHTNNNGIRSVAELATYVLVCRRCKDAHCVRACPVEALEQDPEKSGMLTRHTMLCISCKSCSHACPYGTIYPEHVPLLIHNCDYCLNRRELKNEPSCIMSCPYEALKVMQGDSGLDEHTFLVGDHLMVHSIHWQREKA